MKKEQGNKSFVGEELKNTGGIEMREEYKLLSDYEIEEIIDEFMGGLIVELETKIQDVKGYETLRFSGTQTRYSHLLTKFAIGIAAAEEVVIVGRDVYYLYSQVFEGVGLDRYEQYQTDDYMTGYHYDQIALISKWSVDNLTYAGQEKIDQFEEDAKRYNELRKIVDNVIYNITHEIDDEEMLDYLKWRAGDEYIDDTDYSELVDVYLDLMERASDIVWMWLRRGEIEYQDDQMEQISEVYDRVHHAMDITSL